MKKITSDTINHLLEATRMPKRLQRELVYKPDNYDWVASDFIIVTNKARLEGLFVCEVNDEPTGLYYQLHSVKPDASGRRKPYICDFCSTWLRPSRSCIITFILPKKQHHSVSYRCCLDLHCSLNVRSQTEDAIHSRVQLREDLSEEERISRLQNRLQEIGHRLAN